MGVGGPDLNPEQTHIKHIVDDYIDNNIGNPRHVKFEILQIEKAICSLKKGVSPGIDGLTAEHFIYANCTEFNSQVFPKLNNGMSMVKSYTDYWI